jgi:uncharacterized membrane protein
MIIEIAAGMRSRRAGPAVRESRISSTALGSVTPLHVILTDIPIGASTAAVVFDFIDTANDRKEWQTAADASLAIGLVGAAGPRLQGLTDWQKHRSAGPTYWPHPGAVEESWATSSLISVPQCEGSNSTTK